MAEKSITVKFDGQAHQVELGTFTQVLMNYSDVVRAAAKEAGIDEPVHVCISATEPGSLDVVLSVATDELEGLFALLNDNQGVTSALGLAITSAAGLFNFKKWLAGKKKIDAVEEAGDGAIRVEAGGNVTVIQDSVIQLYRNYPQASESIGSAFRTLEDNPAIEGFEMIDDGKSVFRAERDEFAAIASSPNHEAESVVHESVEETLVVIKPCLIPSKSRKWEFIYDGARISATIADESFMENLSSYSFTLGTRMRVLLDIVKELDPKYATYLNKSYTVTQVLKVAKPETTETDSLF